MTAKAVLGVVLLGAGLVLALVFPELRSLWFEGRTPGILPAVIGAFELFDGHRRRRNLDAGRERPDRG
ncbi:hypothetical protein [Pseudonocardia abyssalis]|uniref:Uncharacterized protein n=1 Tax=Pseudonocardia abyssalis TaxID=2792008 RepID=A0ABS6UQ44_9PSEU|nr:hypothetical protein [Pseudonocardia abyssalis]MBW0118712.1 hypothetical protein [Pseudonocardia abyssalis]MBW0134380.1 hypothetical protein [Pseudonocardia abyssalis]